MYVCKKTNKSKNKLKKKNTNKIKIYALSACIYKESNTDFCYRFFYTKSQNI